MLLDRLGQRLGLNLRYFLTSGGWVTGRYAVLGLLSLGTSAAFARLGTPELYGQYQFVLSVTSLLAILTLPGLNTLSLRSMAQGQPGALARATQLSFRLSWLATVVACGYGVVQLTHGEPVVGWALVAAGGLLPFFYGPNGWYTFYEGNLDFRTPTLRVLLMAGVTSLVIILGLAADWSLVWLIASYFLIGAGLTSLFYVEIQRRLGPPARALDLRLAGWYTFQKVSAGLPDTVQPLIISSTFGFATLGVFLLAYTLVNSASGLMAALSATYFPLLLKHQRLYHGRIILQQLTLGLALAVLYWLFVRICFVPLFGSGFGQSFLLAQLLSGTVVFLPLRIYFTSALTAHAAPSRVIQANVVSYLVGVAAFLLLQADGAVPALTGYLYAVQLSAVLILGHAYYDWARRA